MADDLLALLDGLRLVLAAYDKGDLSPEEAVTTIRDELAPPADVPAAPPPVVPAPPTVGSLLSLARAAHLRYRQAHDRKDWLGQLTAMGEALTYREQADTTDPTHGDLGWQEPPPFNHAALMPFYRLQVSGA